MWHTRLVLSAYHGLGWVDVLHVPIVVGPARRSQQVITLSVILYNHSRIQIIIGLWGSSLGFHCSNLLALKWLFLEFVTAVKLIRWCSSLCIPMTRSLPGLPQTRIGCRILLVSFIKHHD